MMEKLECVLSIEKLKIFSNTLHCLNKIGKELCFELDNANGLALQTLNDSHSASGEFYFPTSFFSNFIVPLSKTKLKCKVYIKTCLVVLKSLKHVQQGTIQFLLDPTTQTISTLIVSLKCNYEITKTHCIQVHDCEMMKAVFDTTACSNYIKTRALHWMSLLQHIHGTSDIYISTSTEQFKLQSYYSNSNDTRTVLQTESLVDVREFEAYQVTSMEPIELIFCLKEVKALLQFCEMNHMEDIVFYFTTSGSPVLFAIESKEPTAQLILSTAFGYTNETQSSQSSNQEIHQTGKKSRILHDNS